MPLYPQFHDVHSFLRYLAVEYGGCSVYECAKTGLLVSACFSFSISFVSAFYVVHADPRKPKACGLFERVLESWMHIKRLQNSHLQVVMLKVLFYLSYPDAAYHIHCKNDTPTS